MGEAFAGDTQKGQSILGAVERRFIDRAVPTEIRIGYIALDTFVSVAGTEIFSCGVPVVVALNVFAFVVMAAQTSRILWQVDDDANVDHAPRP